MGRLPPTSAGFVRFDFCKSCRTPQYQGRRFRALLPHSTCRNISSSNQLLDLSAAFSAANESHKVTLWCAHLWVFPHSKPCMSVSAHTAFRRSQILLLTGSSPPAAQPFRCQSGCYCHSECLSANDWRLFLRPHYKGFFGRAAALSRDKSHLFQFLFFRDYRFTVCRHSAFRPFLVPIFLSVHNPLRLSCEPVRREAPVTLQGLS